MTKDWPNKANLARYFAYWRRRVASRGEFAQSDAGRCGGGPPQGQPRVLCRPLPAAFPKEGAGGSEMSHHNRPAPLRTKGDAGFPEPILHGVRMEEPCVSCLSLYLQIAAQKIRSRRRVKATGLAGSSNHDGMD